ncbi:cysteine export CydDC family ABC transporter permease subunit/ATP-binding protein CydC [secondary endosymbiont of Heteropsylla cubana]|uniref:Cysteine export CydDC family ABC transporter permease subunit/ATP-binding protein CydC n=1 Tax=secondary endosymbiont of Heteropsylla cubana TaxID=134287 RepID=J3VTM0_9ENTR|nr:cysteine/glutathione ABC transporter ATP-binding protein/permease CydC [secondary endosymbiont of Heteropsylla cubana]AFP85331.1 cysteine export CydDC family ABC transporter permease subunit/ATP-binding protein CydC [secondary endosymbiont of Heteropsylla cubana]
MRALFPYLRLYRLHRGQLLLGILLAIISLLASSFLLILSGWFLSGTAIAGAAGLYTFNYMLPAAGVRGAAIIRTVGRWVERVVSHNATFHLLQYLRLYVFKSIFPISTSTTNIRLFRGELLNCLVSDVDTLDHIYLRLISPLVSALVIILIVTISLCFLDLQVGLIFGMIMILILLIFPVGFYCVGKPVGEALSTLRSEYRLQFTTWLLGNAELTLYGASGYYLSLLEITEQRWQIQQRRQSELSAASQNLLLILTGLTLTWVLWIASEKNNILSSPLIAIFVFATLSVFEALSPIAVAFQHLGEVIACAMRLNNLMQKPVEIVFPIFGPSVVSNVSLRFHQVRFSYPGKLVPSINNLTLKVSSGEHVAILGHTGSGKSTLLKLLTRACNPQNGEILLSDISLDQWSESALRKMTSVVEQRLHIFSATLRDNLRLAAPDANDEQLSAILMKVGLGKLLKGEGLNMWLGEGGRALSGGEERRIGIARALLHDSPLWLFDEPTEGLDSVSEHQILKLIFTVGKGRTLIIVTHRLQGLENLDRIYILDEGSIIEEGTHQSLMKQRKRYYYYHINLLNKLKY